MACKLCGAFIQRTFASLTKQCPGVPATRGMQQHLRRMHNNQHPLTGNDKHLWWQRDDSHRIEDAKSKAQEVMKERTTQCHWNHGGFSCTMSCVRRECQHVNSTAGDAAEHGFV
eukprot:5667056-Amphidinium_carterae.1